MHCLCCTVLLTTLSLLIRAGDFWRVSNVVGKVPGWMEAKVGEADLLFPPVQGWEYRAGGDKSDPTMECSREVLPASPDSVVKKKEEEERRKDLLDLLTSSLRKRHEGLHVS